MLNPRLLAHNVAIKKLKPCPRTIVSFFMIAKVVVRCFDQNKGIVASTAPMARYPALPFRKEKKTVVAVKSLFDSEISDCRLPHVFAWAVCEIAETNITIKKLIFQFWT